MTAFEPELDLARAFSRYVPGWLIAERESAALAERLLAETIAAQYVARDQLTIPADRGTSSTGPTSPAGSAHPARTIVLPGVLPLNTERLRGRTTARDCSARLFGATVRRDCSARLFG